MWILQPPPIKFISSDWKTICANDSILEITSIDISSSYDHYVLTDETSLDNPISSNKKDKANVLNVTNYLIISINIKAYLRIPNEWNLLLALLSTKGYKYSKYTIIFNQKPEDKIRLNDWPNNFVWILV